MRLFHGLIFFRYFGSLPPPADNRIVRNCDALVPRYIHISAFPNGVRYSVLALLVLTSPVKSDILILVCTTTASSCAVHAHASRHFRASPFPAGVRCKASPVVRTIATDFFIRCFFVRNRTLTCTTTASSCAVHAHASRHFCVSPSPIGVRCKASPVVRTKCVGL